MDNAHQHTHVRTHGHTQIHTCAHAHTQSQGRGKTDYSFAGEGVTKYAASGTFGMFCHHVVTKRAGVTKCTGSASNLTRFVTLVIQRAATGTTQNSKRVGPSQELKWRARVSGKRRDQ